MNEEHAVCALIFLLHFSKTTTVISFFFLLFLPVYEWILFNVVPVIIVIPLC